MIQRLHKLSHFCLLYSFVVLVISSFIFGRAGEVGSLDLRSSRALLFSNIFVGTGSVLIRCRPEGNNNNIYLNPMSNVHRVQWTI